MSEPFATKVLRWYAGAARELPWRADDATPWGVVVSEFMLQQTPVARVLPVWHEWMSRWPEPTALAAEPAGEAVRAWGRLGYPRRALRLHASAQAIARDHGGVVPSTVDELRALPGIGDYTAAAIASFAFGARTAVLDANVRRVNARVFAGVAEPTSTPSVAERAAALARVPATDPGRFSVAVMELGALVCRARGPRCDGCPVAVDCAWLNRGRPASAVGRRTQSYEGTDRQARGRLLAVLRDSPEPVPVETLDEAWADRAQRHRALASLVEDGLVDVCDDGRYALPA